MANFRKCREAGEFSYIYSRISRARSLRPVLTLFIVAHSITQAMCTTLLFRDSLQYDLQPSRAPPYSRRSPPPPSSAPPPANGNLHARTHAVGASWTTHATERRERTLRPLSTEGPRCVLEDEDQRDHSDEQRDGATTQAAAVLLLAAAGLRELLYPPGGLMARALDVRLDVVDVCTLLVHEQCEVLDQGKGQGQGPGPG